MAFKGITKTAEKPEEHYVINARNKPFCNLKLTPEED